MNINTNPVRDYRFNYMNININPVKGYRFNYMNINPVRDYRSVENRCHKILHAVRYATRMLLFGCIPYGMQGLYGIHISTGRYIPMECSIHYNIFLPNNTFLWNVHFIITFFYRAIHSYGMFNSLQHDFK